MQITFRDTEHQAINADTTPAQLVEHLYALRQAPINPDHSLSGLPAPETMRHLDRACALVSKHIQADQHILIVGDFDADGATSTALLMLGLRSMGATKLDYIVPSRHTHGYGLTPKLVDIIQAERQASLLITVDNGIAAHAGIAAAKKAGYEVLITDHHLPADTLPAADAIINPNQPNCNFPEKNLAGVGVAFYLLIGLRQYFIGTGWFTSRQQKPPNLAQWMDLVAIGTISDVVKLTPINRILVEQGLLRLRAGQCLVGVQALLNSLKIPQRLLSATDIGFGLGPKINAAGRLDDMHIGISCLLSETLAEANAYVDELISLNKSRQALQSEFLDEALRMIETQPNLAEQNIICLYQPHWHSGIVGLIAGQIKNRYHRPCLVFGAGDDNSDNITELKGSARSVSGWHIRDFLDWVDRIAPDTILRFGGHAMAAGLSITADDFAQFQSACAKAAEHWLPDFTPEPNYQIDAILPNTALSLAHALAIRISGPWGNGFEAPMFLGIFIVNDSRLVSGGHFKLTIAPQGSVNEIEAMVFSPTTPQPAADEVIKCLYQLDVNAWAGRLKPQLLIEQIIPT